MLAGGIVYSARADQRSDLQALLHRLSSSGAPDLRSGRSLAPSLHPGAGYSGRLTFAVLLPSSRGSPYTRDASRFAECSSQLPSQEKPLFTYVIYICITASLGAAAVLFCALSFEAIRDV